MRKSYLAFFLFFVGCGPTGSTTDNNGNNSEEIDGSVVTILQDIVSESDGEVSLREAISFARANNIAVTFIQGLTGTIDFQDGAIELGESDDVEIVADAPITFNAISTSRHFTSEGANLSVKGLTFIGGFVEGGTRGGGSILFESGALTVENCEFKNNDNQSGVGAGGAIAIEENASLSVSGSEFSANKSATNGASIWSESSATFKIVDSVFKDHLTDGRGVVYYEGSGDFEISDSKFENNKIDRGALYITKRSGKASVDTVVFENNEADYGAAIVLDYFGTETEADLIQLTIKDSTFTKNLGETTGAVDLDASTTVIVENSNFTENKTKNNGGGAIHSGGALKIIGGTFTKNSALGDNIAIPASGGAIDVSGLASHLSLEIEDATFTENSADAGGAVSIESGIKMDIKNTTFSKNTARVSGGALTANSAAATISGGSFTENSVVEEVAFNGGGAIETSSDLSVIGVTITGNSAPSGGGIFIAVSTLTIGAGTVISDNDAYKTSTLPQGGGVCNSSSDITGSAAVTSNTPQDFCDDARAN